MNDNNHFDVIIIGGSYAGLSAAMALGRSLRKVLIIDGGRPCNRQTPHSHNFITQDGEKPAVIAEKARTQVLQYRTVSFLNDFAISGNATDEGFAITTRTSQTYSAKKLVFATGIKDLLPDNEGFADCWGISVIHCPYCHGYEVKGEITGILDHGDTAMHLASLVNNLTDDLTIFTNGQSDFTAEQTAQLTANQIKVENRLIERLEHQNGQLERIHFTDGPPVAIKALYARVPFVQHSDIPESLGCQLTEQGFIEVNAMQQTSVPGVFACGDNTTPMRSVASAVAGGNFAGAVVNKELCSEQF
ncbi:NAD(P)/FAD-dependent oxidoreductase [Flavilitoribacter nigricans]|uniref:Pyridine nucleotide-disulfide oxidoreductase n=1 Tax=Flavilitoribacter nigricans (strain ATCC 23147 / DSM 23189 / NBRC 102662 / NCIMB 1420 / SS-2) TaxID=1122177 RepID=A0A2D0N4Q0_FLAN2|nr:NAD(P)/FAD-dependent oxidoreductase [Flavilitoribacter nigricans]PHN03512.1 pyridine nucleotide-disulfide oxidoreductase [Flavilitoribacter nigricans DSM 23189 = NBRC 102662]